MGENTKRVKTRKGVKGQSKSRAEERECRLGKRLTYLLRYGAEKEGLVVTDAGFVDVGALQQASHIRSFSSDEVLLALNKSRTDAGVKKFEVKCLNGVTYARASYGRRMERHPCHENSGVLRLLEICLDCVCNTLEQYDLTDFQDEYLLDCMIHKLRRSQRLNNKAWPVVMVPSLEHVDFHGVYITNHTLRLLADGCPNLRTLKMRKCAYIATDHTMQRLIKKLPRLENINLCLCHHLTDVTVRSLQKHCPNLVHVNLAHLPLVTECAILDLIFHCDWLEYLNISGNKNITSEGRLVLAEFSEQRNVTIVLKDLEVDSHKVISS